MTFEFRFSSVLSFVNQSINVEAYLASISVALVGGQYQDQNRFIERDDPGLLRLGVELAHNRTGIAGSDNMIFGVDSCRNKCGMIAVPEWRIGLYYGQRRFRGGNTSEFTGLFGGDHL